MEYYLDEDLVSEIMMVDLVENFRVVVEEEDEEEDKEIEID